MARILFKGSKHVSGVDRNALFAAAQALGYAAAARGHTLLLGSDSPNTVDQHVKLGVEAFCAAFPERPARIEVHRADDGRVPFAATRIANLEIVRRAYAVLTTTPPAADTMNWVVAHVGALDASDALVLLGGGEGTEFAGRVAAERQWPIIPIASFGGAARTLYSLLNYELRRQPLIAAHLHLLNGPWEPDSASRIVDLIERVVTRTAPHSYFLSYQHADATAADRVELLLHRAKRSILRDERALSPGDPLDASITTRIAMATTFLALHSRHYWESDYCRGELAIAHELKRSGNKPQRLVALRLDDAILSPLVAGSAWLRAGDRDQLSSAVERIIGDEGGLDS